MPIDIAAAPPNCGVKSIAPPSSSPTTRASPAAHITASPPPSELDEPSSSEVEASVVLSVPLESDEPVLDVLVLSATVVVEASSLDPSEGTPLSLQASRAQRVRVDVLAMPGRNARGAIDCTR